MQKFRDFAGWRPHHDGWHWDGEPGTEASPRPITTARAEKVGDDLWLLVEVAIVPTRVRRYWAPDRRLVLSLERRGFTWRGAASGSSAGRYWSISYSLDDIRHLAPFLTSDDAAALRQRCRDKAEECRQRANLDKPLNGSPHGRVLDDGELRPRQRKPGPGRAGKDGAKRLTPDARAQRQAEARRRWREKNMEMELEQQRLRRQAKKPQACETVPRDECGTVRAEKICN